MFPLIEIKTNRSGGVSISYPLTQEQGTNGKAAAAKEWLHIFRGSIPR